MGGQKVVKMGQKGSKWVKMGQNGSNHLLRMREIDFGHFLSLLVIFFVIFAFLGHFSKKKKSKIFSKFSKFFLSVDVHLLRMREIDFGHFLSLLVIFLSFLRFWVII